MLHNGKPIKYEKSTLLNNRLQVLKHEKYATLKNREHVQVLRNATRSNYNSQQGENVGGQRETSAVRRARSAAGHAGDGLDKSISCESGIRSKS